MKYFTIKELCRTTHKVENVPNQNQINNLIYLTEKVLDPAREELDKAITVNSGFRSKKLNAIVGGSTTSQHSRGEAADLKCSDNKKLFNIIKNQNKFDQLIWEFGNDEQPGWVHVSCSKVRQRGEILKAKMVNGERVYMKMN